VSCACGPPGALPLALDAALLGLLPQSDVQAAEQVAALIAG